MIKSMTGFAARTGTAPPHGWTWELRSVNGKGLDLRLRVPDWVDGLEIALRKAITARAHRGSITCTLRIAREEGAGVQTVNEAQLDSVLEALTQIEARAMDRGLSLAPSKATDVAALRGVLEQNTTQDDTTALCQTLLADFAPMLDAFDEMRAQEGAAILDMLEGQLAEIEALIKEAKLQADTRKAEMAERLHQNLSLVLRNAEGADETRVAQELALLAVKADVTEEIDRLIAHVAAARALLSEGGAMGRKLDFLMQEFNREANTLCSKAQKTELTRIGLALKAVIDQMREQIQNVE